MSKTEAISWFRIYEMFKFQSFHMYGIIGSAVVIGVPLFALIRKGFIKDFQGNHIHIEPKKKGIYRTLIGGTIFGLGWALVGACPGPMFVILGQGVLAIVVVILGALIGAFLYHSLKHKLPH